MRECGDLRGSVINLLDFNEKLSFASCDVIFVHSFGVEFGSKYPLVLCTGIQFIV
jgi:hypothetical protein